MKFTGIPPGSANKISYNIRVEQMAFETAAEGADLALELVALRHQIDSLKLRFPQVATAFDQTEYWDREGSNSAIDWIRFKCPMTSTAAADRDGTDRQRREVLRRSEALAACQGKLARQVSLQMHALPALCRPQGLCSRPGATR